MGKVFTWKEITQRHVPKPQGFVAVLDEVRSRLQQEEGIIGAVACGSVVRGDASLRSDLDIFVLFGVAYEARAFDRMRELVRYARQAASVPLSFVVCSDQVAKTRMHHVGDSFRRHLERSAAAGGLLKGSPLASIEMQSDEQAELLGYLRMKLYKLETSLSAYSEYSEERRVSFLQKALEAPINTARKVLNLVDGSLEDDSKKAVLARYAQVMPAKLGEELTGLVHVDTAYTLALECQFNMPDLDSYMDMHDSLHGHAAAVARFVRKNVLLVAQHTTR